MTPALHAKRRQLCSFIEALEARETELFSECEWEGLERVRLVLADAREEWKTTTNEDWS